MAISITVRNVPETVRDALAERAERRGQSLQAYLVQELHALAETVDQYELMQHIKKRKEGSGVRLDRATIVDAVHADCR